MANIAVVGHPDSIMGFQAAGMDVFAATDPTGAARAINRLAAKGYAVVLVTEQVAEMVPDTIRYFKGQPYPAIIPIPGATGSTGYGMAQVRKNVEKAIGSNILGND